MIITTKFSKEFKKRFDYASYSVENLSHFRNKTQHDVPEDVIERLKATTIKVPMYDKGTGSYDTIDIPVLEVAVKKIEKAEADA